MNILKRAWLRLTFDATKEYGQAISYIGKYSEIPKVTIDALKESAYYYLPKGLYCEIRGKVSTDFGRNKGIAWYYKPGHWRRVHNGDFDLMNGAYYRIEGFLVKKLS